MCSLCGTAQWEWEENRFAYDVEEHYCHGCYLKAVAGEGKDNLPGTTITLSANTEQQKAQKFLMAKARAAMDVSQGDADED